ncbi:MAG TPA: S8 family serine peptidase [Mycobacteriales bacterium]|nr:S8 family serine peptidase [Mycobacteriales bacterium]
MSRVRRLPALLAVAVAASAGAAVAQTAPRPLAAPDSAGRWVRVQLADRVLPEQVDSLAASGLAGLQYVPDNAYVAYGTQAAVTAAAAVAGVTGIEQLDRADKLDRSLLTAARPRVTVLGFRPERSGLDAALTALGARRHTAYNLTDAGLAVREVTLPVAALDDLADRGDVLLVTAGTGTPQVEDEATALLLATTEANSYSPKPGYEKFLKSVKADGTGVVVTVIDEGIDPNHPEFAGRVAKRYAHSPVPAEGHGTHVGGIVGGKGAAVPVIGRVKDDNDLLYGLGVAPGVRFVDINAISTGAEFPAAGGFGDYTKEALAAGSSLWNASWTSGEGAGAGYIANAALLDALTRDGHDAKAGAQPFTFVFSAGNSGGPEAKITAPKEAKNIIAVASTVAPRDPFPIGSAPDEEKTSSFSSRGPARDGRLVPTVTAPGENVSSARATTGTTCGESPPVDSFVLYSLCSGTSMAAPQVTGAVALLTHWWRQRNGGRTQSPAMSKAMLVNSAVDIGEADIPNITEGWGRVSTGAMLDPRSRRVLVDQQVVLSRRDAAYGVNVVPVDPSKPMKVTLSWTDVPGLAQDPRTTDRDTETFSPAALVNDLDLRVDGAGGSFLGNIFTSGLSVRGGKPDRLNNLENVFVAKPRGAYRVTVRAHNLPGDGVPGNARRTDQDFALVISNARVIR